ncbi:MAG TPA: response regulator transcription factor, partial [Thermoflexales bacterium]|nr:response regulator transcription factor [Thermoflexales bacterium]
SRRIVEDEVTTRLVDYGDRRRRGGEARGLFVNRRRLTEPLELTSRVKAVIRRAELPSQVDKAPVKVDDHLAIDFNHREVLVDGKPVKLRPTEWRLLYHLVQNAGWVVPHEALLSKVWGWEYRDETQYLRLYITYLRQKIEKDLADPHYILTERGVGYKFVDFKKN